MGASSRLARRRLGPVLPKLSTGTYELVFVPPGIVGANVATTWKNASGHTGRDATASGAPVRGAVGHLSGVVLDGVDDCFTGSISLASDRPLTLFVLAKAVTPPNGTLRVLFEVSDTGATARSLALVQGNGYRDLRVSQVATDGDAFYAFASEQLNLDTGRAMQGERQLRQNGKAKASNCLDAGAARAPTTFRIGGALGGGGNWPGTFVAAILVSGVLSDLEMEEVEASILTWARMQVPPKGLISGPYNDLHLVMPAVIDAIVGEPVTIWTSGETTVSTSLPLDLSYPDRITVTPSAPGDANLTITDGGVQATSVVHAVAALAVDASPLRVLLIGDSNFTNMAALAGAMRIMLAEFGSKIVFVGTQGADPIKGEGRGGWGYNTFNNTDPLQPVNGGSTLANSPLKSGATFIISTYRASLSGPPDIIVYGLGGNDVYSQTLATVDARIDAMLVDAEAIWAAWRADSPNIIQIVTSPWVTCSDPSIHGNPIPSMQLLHQVNRRCVQRLEAALAGRSAERLYHRPTFMRVDPMRGYADAFHMNQSPGGAQVLRALRPSLVARWPARRAVLQSAVVDGNVSASKLRLNFDLAAHFPNTTGVSVTFTNGTPRTITGIDSGNDSTTPILSLSGPVAGTDVFTVAIGPNRTQTTVIGGEPIAPATANVSIQNLSNPILTSAGTLQFWPGADSVVLSSSSITTFTDKGPKGNHFTQTTAAKKATIGTTAGGNKFATFDGAAAENQDFYEALLVEEIPAGASLTFYVAVAIDNWNPSGGYSAVLDVTANATEGGNYSSGFFVTPAAGSYWRFGYGVDATDITNVLADAAVHVWAWTVVHDGTYKVYRDGVEIDSGTTTVDPAAWHNARLGMLFYTNHVGAAMRFFQGPFFAGADVANAHDAALVASNSTYLATLTT